MITEQLSRAQLDAILKTISGIDYSSISIGEIQTILKPIINHLDIETVTYNPGFYLYRSRVCDTKPDNIKQLTYPSGNLVLKYGRANEVGESMYYGSITKNGSIFESNPMVGSEFFISTWRTKDDMAVSQMGFTRDVAQQLKSERNFEELYAFLKTINQKDDLRKLAYNSIALLFAQEVQEGSNAKYKLPIAIAKSLLYTSAQVCNGLLYPSFAMFGNTDNIVLKPEFVNDYLEFESVEYLVVKKVDGISYEFAQLDTSLELDVEGNIIWSGKQLGWTNVPQGAKISKKFGENAQLIDPQGQIIKRTYSDPIKLQFTDLETNFYADHGHLKSFKLPFDYPDPSSNVRVQCQVFLDLNANQKFLSFYIPSTPDVVDVAIYCLHWHKEFLAKVDDENIPFNNFIYLYTEDRIPNSQDVKDLYPEIMLGFCTNP